MSVFTVSTLARRYGVAPRKISDLFYSREIDDQACPIVAGRRLIPADFVPKIEAALRERGLLLQPQEAVA
jgi:hypothetical protein